MIASTPVDDRARSFSFDGALDALQQTIDSLSKQLLAQCDITHLEHVLIEICRIFLNVLAWTAGSTNTLQSDRSSVEIAIKENNQHVLDQLNVLLETLKVISVTTPTYLRTLEPLHLMHEIATVALLVTDYMARPPISTQKSKIPFLATIHSVASTLRSEVHQHAVVVKSHLDNGGWLDQITQQVLKTEGHRDQEVDDKGSAKVDLGEIVEAVLGYDFVESWAVELTESWNESVAGLLMLQHK